LYVASALFVVTYDIKVTLTAGGPHDTVALLDEGCLAFVFNFTSTDVVSTLTLLLFSFLRGRYRSTLQFLQQQRIRQHRRMQRPRI